MKRLYALVALLTLVIYTLFYISLTKPKPTTGDIEIKPRSSGVQKEKYYVHYTVYTIVTTSY